MSENKTTILEFANNYKKKMETSFYSHSQLFRLHGHLRNSLCFLCFLCVVFLSIILSFLSEFVFFFHFKYTQPQGKTTDDFSKTKFAVFIYQFNQFKETFDA